MPYHNSTLLCRPKSVSGTQVPIDTNGSEKISKDSDRYLHFDCSILFRFVRSYMVCKLEAFLNP